MSLQDLTPLFASDQGYLESFHAHKESVTGNDWYDLVLVSHGLSHKGELFREGSKQTKTTNREPEDIVQIRPSFGGITFNERTVEVVEGKAAEAALNKKISGSTVLHYVMATWGRIA